MNILLQTKEEVETHFGKKATMAPNLLGMVGQGEESYGFLTGDMSEGFDITVGFLTAKRATSRSRNALAHRGAKEICEQCSAKSGSIQTGRSNRLRSSSITWKNEKKES